MSAGKPFCIISDGESLTIQQFAARHGESVDWIIEHYIYPADPCTHAPLLDPTTGDPVLGCPVVSMGRQKVICGMSFNAWLAAQAAPLPRPNVTRGIPNAQKKTRRKTAKELIEQYRLSAYKPRNEEFYRFQYWDPRLRKRRYKRTRHHCARDAWDQAMDFIRALDQGESTDLIAWDDFCRQYELRRVRHKSEKNAESWRTTKRWIREYWPFAVQWLQDVANREAIRDWQDRLLDERGLAEASVSCYSARLKAALHWACDEELIGRVPKIRIHDVRSRGGAISFADLEKMCEIARRIRPRDHIYIQRFLRGLFWSGFRLNELRQLSWERGSKLWLDVSGVNGIPVVWISRSGQKSRRDDVRYILREFWDLCQPVKSNGFVFWLPNGRGGQMSQKTIGDIIAGIGRAAGIVVDPETGKHASAHDLRKSCSAVLYQKGYQVYEIGLFLGHQDEKTTKAHYTPVTAATLIAREWHRGAQ